MRKKSGPKIFGTWRSTTIAIIVIALFTSLVLVTVYGWVYFKEMLESPGAPAWIQAIGSVLAIVAAAEIARQQSQSASDLEAKKQAAAEKQTFEVIMALMARAHGLSNDICRAFETHRHEDFDQVTPALMVNTHHALQALPVFEIPNGLLALDVLTISHGLASLHEGWLELREEASRESKKLVQRMKELDVLAREVREISQQALNECKKEIAKRSSKELSNG